MHDRIGRSIVRVHAPGTAWPKIVFPGSTFAMATKPGLTIFAAIAFSCLALPAVAADRMRPGQWVGTTVAGGRTFPTSSCIAQSDADAMNGDAAAVAAYLAKTIPPEVCKISDVKAQGTQVVYTASCGKLPPKIVTTSYQGDSSAGSDNTGSTTTAKLVGPCK